MRSDIAQRLLALPPDSEQRQQILTLFSSFSMATVILRIDRETPDNRQQYEDKIEAILSGNGVENDRLSSIG